MISGVDDTLLVAIGLLVSGALMYFSGIEEGRRRERASQKHDRDMEEDRKAAEELEG